MRDRLRTRKTRWSFPLAVKVQSVQSLFYRAYNSKPAKLALSWPYKPCLTRAAVPTRSEIQDAVSDQVAEMMVTETAQSAVQAALQATVQSTVQATVLGDNGRLEKENWSAVRA